MTFIEFHATSLRALQATLRDSIAGAAKLDGGCKLRGLKIIDAGSLSN